MSTRAPSLGWLPVSGTPYDIGRALGQQGREAVHVHLIPSPDWQQMTHLRYAAVVQRMMRRTKTAYPWIYAELEGVADGLGVAFDDVFAWNCRGDLLAHAPDGCTTVQLPGATPVVAHNEDGPPALDGHCFIAEVSPAARTGFLSFCYPGSIAGHAFGVSERGLVVTANNLRLTHVTPEIPRMVLSRAVLDADGIDAAMAILGATPASSGFHLTLAQAGDSRVISVEYGGGRVAAWPITEPSIHANHAVCLPTRGADQVVTASSRDRQKRGDALLSSGCRDPLQILRDTGGSGWPIWRRGADDSDRENTLATAVFRVHPDTVDWSFHHGASNGSSNPLPHRSRPKRDRCFHGTIDVPIC